MATAEAKLHVTEFNNEPFIDFSNPDNHKKMQEALKKVKAEFGHEYPMWIGGQKVVTAGQYRVGPGVVVRANAAPDAEAPAAEAENTPPKVLTP